MVRSVVGFLHQNCSKLMLKPDEVLRISVAHNRRNRGHSQNYEWSPCQGPFKAKRSLKPQPYWVSKKATPTHDLTSDNREFLQEVVRDTYENMVTASKSPLKEEPWPRNDWTLLPVTKRAGVIGMKLGTMPQWTKDGKRFFVTLVQVIDNHVIRYHSPEETQRLDQNRRRARSGLSTVVVGALSTDPTKLAKSYVNLFTEAGVPPKRKLVKFYVTPNAAVAPGTPIGVNHYRVGDYVDVYSRSIGRGFQGVVKRWGFKGGPATHGTTKWHRRRGSLSGGDWSRVFAGTKMPGHMGNKPVNMRGLKIWRINTKYNVLYLHGTGVAGPVGAYVKIKDSGLVQCKEKLVDRPPPMPTWYPEDALEPIPEEIYDENLFNFDDDSIVYEEKS